MADDIELNTGSGGATIKTDDDGAAHWQYVKLAFGADNTQTIVSTSNALPVDLRTDNLSGNLDINIAAQTSDVTIADGGNSITVDGTVTADAGTGTFTVDNGGTFATQSACTNAGTFAVQEDGAALTALQLIDDSVYVDDADWTALTSKHLLFGGIYQSTPGSITDGDTGPLRLDANGAVHINDGGNSITVDGTVTANAGTGTFTVDGSGVTQPVSGTITANLSATDNAVLDQIEVNTSYGDNTGAGTEAGALRVTIANDSTGVLSVDDNGGSITVDNGGTFATQATLQAGTAEIGKLAAGTAEIGNVTNSGTFAVQSTLSAETTKVIGTVNVAAAQTIATTNAGTFATQATLQTGSSLVGDVGISGARTSGGTTLYKNIDVDESEDQVKATAGQLYWLHAINLGTAPRYLKIYNATAASVVVGTTVPDLTFPIPTQGDANGAGFALSIPNGIAFGTAITIAATTGVADADSGAPGANEVIVNLGYA